MKKVFDYINTIDKQRTLVCYSQNFSKYTFKPNNGPAKTFYDYTDGKQAFDRTCELIIYEWMENKSEFMDFITKNKMLLSKDGKHEANFGEITARCIQFAIPNLTIPDYYYAL